MFRLLRQRAVSVHAQKMATDNAMTTKTTKRGKRTTAPENVDVVPPKTNKKAKSSPSASEAVAPKKERKKAEDVVIPRAEISRREPPADGALLRLLSWNVNGLRAVFAKKRETMDKLLSENPDCIFLQETKLQLTHEQDFNDLFPGYKKFFTSSSAKKGYAGTALFLRDQLADSAKVKFGIGLEKHDKEGRSITLSLPHCNIVALYVPNAGQKLERLDYRTKEWDRDLRTYVRSLASESGKPCIICGDLNVAHRDIDLYNPTAKHIPKSAGCTDAERNSFTELLEEDGFLDSFRHLHPEAEGAYSYWSTRGGGRPFNRGLRLDYFCIPKNLVEPDNEFGVVLHDSYILHKLTEGASDHCPVGLDLVLK